MKASKYSIRFLSKWYRTPTGKKLANIVHKYINRKSKRIVGDNYLHFTTIGYDEIVKDFKTRNRCIVDIDKTDYTNQIQCSFDSLPVEGDSIDIVFLPHVLEYENNVDEVLSEVYRVLAPGGKMFVIGFNRMSFWNVLQRSHFIHSHVRPVYGNIHSIYHVKKLLLEHNFTILSIRTLCNRSINLLEKNNYLSKFIEIIGDFLWPRSGLLYIFMVEKKVIPMTTAREKLAYVKELLAKKGPQIEGERTYK